jgi:hypothetical protein
MFTFVSPLPLAAVNQHSAAAAPLTGSHLLWIVLVVLLIGLILPDWVGWILVAVVLVALGAPAHVPHGGGGGGLLWLLVAAAALVLGLHFGRIRGLRHLGESEFRTRRANIRRISRF